MMEPTRPSESLRTIRLANDVRALRNAWAHRHPSASAHPGSALQTVFQRHGFSTPDTAGLRYFGDFPFTTPAVVEAIALLLAGKTFSNALDPWGGCGWLLGALSEMGIVTKGTGVTVNPDCAALARSVGHSFGLEWVNADGRKWLASAEGGFDLIVSEPPWNMEPREELTVASPNGPVTIRDDAGNLLILESCQKLSEAGIGIFVVPPSFVFREGSTVYRNLAALGFRVDAFFGLPAGSSTFFNVRGGIVVIGRGSSKRLFVGEFVGLRQRDEVLVSNYRSSETGKDFGLGLLIEPSQFHGIDALRAEEKTRRLAKQFGYDAAPLTAVVRTVRLAKDSAFPASPDAVYLPMIGRSEALTAIDELKLKTHNYAQLIVDSTQVNPEYLAHFLNTPIGLSIREEGLSGATIPKLTRSGIERLRVFLPPLSAQERVVEVLASISQIEAALEEHRQRLWSEPHAVEKTAREVAGYLREESFKEWLDRLPFPLASILWVYHTAGDEQRRYEHLLHFFEALAEFLAVILLSAVRPNESLLKEAGAKGGLKEELSRARVNSFDLGTFGVWCNTHSILAKHLRALYNKGKAGRELLWGALFTSDNEVVEMLVSSDLVSLLSEANTYRNDWQGHTGVVGEKEAARRHDILRVLLGRVRKSFGTVWDRYALVLPGLMRFKDGVYHYSVRRLVGRTAPFEQFKVNVSRPMEEGNLHLISPTGDSALELIPFVQMMASPEFAENACYFYNRVTRGEVRFVSYHFDREAEVHNTDPSVLSVLADLTTRSTA